MSELAVEQQTTSRGGFGKLLSRVKEALLPINNKIPLESINDKTAAWAIDTFLGNPLRERVGGDRWANEFSLPTVLANTGSVSSIERDYMKKFHEEFPVWRQVMQKLVNEGVLQAIPLQEPDYNYETIHYKVVDPERLKEFAKQGKTLLKK